MNHVPNAKHIAAESSNAPTGARSATPKTRILPALTSRQWFRAAIQAFRDIEAGNNSTDTGAIRSIATKEPNGEHHISELSIASTYALSHRIIGRLRRPEFVANPYGNIFNLLSNLENLFPEGDALRKTLSRDISAAERAALVYGLFFIHIDRTYFRHKHVRVPETILEFLRREDTQIQSLGFLKESLARHGHKNRHLESGFCLLAGDDSYELGELVAESARDTEHGIGGSPSRMAITRLEQDMTRSVAELQKEFSRIISPRNRAKDDASSELSAFLLQAELLVSRFSVFLDIMNWSMAPYAEEPAHRPFIFLLRGHIDSMESTISDLLQIIAAISKQYPSDSPQASSRQGTLITMLQIRTRWIHYTLCKLRLNTAPILFEHEVQKWGDKTAENLALYRQHIARFDQRVAEAYQDLDNIATLCDKLSAHYVRPVDKSPNPTAERVDRAIGDMNAFISREHERATREQRNLHKYQESCNRGYLSFSLATYEPNPVPETEGDLRAGIGNVLDMQSGETPNLRGAIDAPTRGNARLRGRQFLLWFATNPPSDPDTFRVTVENAYQIFRAIGIQERPDNMLLPLTELLIGLLADNAETTRARRASLQVAFLLLEVIRTLRTRLAQSRAPSRESGEILVRFSKFVSDMSDAGNTADTFGRICVEVARIHADLATRGRRGQEADPSPTRDIIAECLRRASYLHPNLPGVLDKMSESERRNLLSIMTGESVDGIQEKNLSWTIQRKAVAQGAEARREKLSGLFSDAIRETVKKLLDEEEKNPGASPANAIAHLQRRLENGPLKEIERSVLNGLGKVHFVVLDVSKLDSLDTTSCLQAGIRSCEIPRDRHVSSVAVYGGVMAFVEHEPMATDRIQGIMRREGLDHALDELCLAVTDLQNGLDLASLTDKCVNGLAQRKGTIANGCDIRVIDQETGVVHAGSRRHGTPREETREWETCYLVVQDAAPSTPRRPGSQPAYTRQMRFKATKNPAPSYLRLGSTVILSVADLPPYLQHIVKQGLVPPDILRRMDVRVDASLERAIPIMGTVLRVDDDEVIVNIAGPLTLARYHLALERARRNGGAPFISSDDTARARSMPQLLELAGRTRRGTTSTVPVPVFVGESRRDQQTSRAVSFFGRTGMRIVFELGTDSAERLSASLTANRDLARPLRLLSNLRGALLADIRIACQRAGTISGREILERLSNMAMQHIELDPSAEPLVKSFTTSIAAAIGVDITLTPISVDQILRERLEDIMGRISGSATILSSFSSLPEFEGILDGSGQARVTLSGGTVTLRSVEVDKLFVPVVSPNGTLVEIGFTFEPDSNTQGFLARARSLTINHTEGVQQSHL